eukprot:3105999-Rhodomonas_salina.1
MLPNPACAPRYAKDPGVHSACKLDEVPRGGRAQFFPPSVQYLSRRSSVTRSNHNSHNIRAGMRNLQDGKASERGW